MTNPSSSFIKSSSSSTARLSSLFEPGNSQTKAQSQDYTSELDSHTSNFSIFTKMAIQGIGLVVLVDLVSVVLAVLVTVLAVYFSRCWGNCTERRKGRIEAAAAAKVCS
jgi:hypothetical protein